MLCTPPPGTVCHTCSQTAPPPWWLQLGLVPSIESLEAPPPPRIHPGSFVHVRHPGFLPLRSKVLCPPVVTLTEGFLSLGCSQSELKQRFHGAVSDGPKESQVSGDFISSAPRVIESQRFLVPPAEGASLAGKYEPLSSSINSALPTRFVSAFVRAWPFSCAPPPPRSPAAAVRGPRAPHPVCLYALASLSPPSIAEPEDRDIGGQDLLL